MKKVLVILAVAIALLALPAIVAGNCACDVAAINVSGNLSEGKIFNISGHYALKPQTFCVNGVMGGDAITKVLAVFKQNDLQADPVCSGLWFESLGSLDNGLIDVIASIFVKDERLMKYRFFGPTGKDYIGIFVNDNSSIEINDTGDLIGRKIVTTKEESWGYLIDYLIDQKVLNVVKVDTPQEAFDLVKEGKAECFLYSIPAGEGVIATYGLSGFKHSAVIETMNFYAAILAGSPYADVMAQAFENSSLPEFKGDPILA